MKLELDKRPTQLFIGVLVITALVINAYFWNTRRLSWSQPESPYSPTAQPSRAQNNSGGAPGVDSAAAGRAEAQAAEARRQAEAAQAAEAQRQATLAQAAEARRQYLARYLNPGAASRAGTKTVALAVASEDGKLERTVSNALAQHFKSDGAEIVGSFFNPEFVSDGLLGKLFSDAPGVIRNLELDKRLAAVLVARETVEYSTNPSLENVMTANMRLEVLALSANPNGDSATWTLMAAGAGFNQKAARAMAEERILKQLTADTRMSLNQVIASK